MTGDRLAVLAVAALAVAALAAGAATVEDVERSRPTPVATDGPTPTASGDTGRSGARAPESTAEAACPNCPSTDWPGLLGLLGDVPGAPLAALVAVLVLAAALSWHALGRDPSPGTEDGPAADRSATVPDREPMPSPTLDAPPPDNEVFRAWRDLRERAAERADGDVAVLTPREVAATARTSGLPSDAASELTALFRRVRYGGRAPSQPRERRAAAAREQLGLAGSDEDAVGDGRAAGDEEAADEERAADGGELR